MRCAYRPSGLFIIYATLSNTLLNSRYRVQMLADTLLKLANLIRTQAIQFVHETTPGQDGPVPLIGQLMRQQAVLADHLQAARNILLESPNTIQRQKLAGILMQVLEMRDHLLACVLDLDTLQAYPGTVRLLSELCAVLSTLAHEVEQLADALLLGRQPQAFESLRPALLSLSWPDGDDSPVSVLEATATCYSSVVGYCCRIYPRTFSSMGGAYRLDFADHRCGVARQSGL